MEEAREEDLPPDPVDTEADNDRTVMVVEITGGILKNIRSTRKYANLSGHEVDFIAFMTHQGTYLAEVMSTRKKVSLNEVYKNMESDNKTNMYTLGPLVKKVIYNIVVKNLENINEAFTKRASGN